MGTRAVYCASFFDTIQYNMYSCVIRYIGWTIFINISSEKDKKKKMSENNHGTLVINRFRHVCGAFGWLGDKFIMSLVMDSDICFPTGCCNSLEHKLHSAASYSFFAEYSQNLFAFCKRPFLNFERSKVLFSNWRYIGVSSKQCIVYRLTDVYRYVSIYLYIDSPLMGTILYKTREVQFCS